MVYSGFGAGGFLNVHSPETVNCIMLSVLPMKKPAFGAARRMAPLIWTGGCLDSDMFSKCLPGIAILTAMSPETA